MKSSSKKAPAVVVTGVSSGIGKGIACDLVASGYRVFGSIRTPDDAAQLQQELGDNFEPIIFDVRYRDAIREEAARVAHRLRGRSLCGLINNAGVAEFGPLECLDDDRFENSIAVNLFGVRNVTNAFLPMIRSSATERPGKIINISSLSGILNTPMNGAYCVSKHALESLSDIYRRELMPAGIDVVSIRSGPIDSEIWNKSRADSDSFDDSSYTKMARKARRYIRRAEIDALPTSAIATLVKDILEGRKSRVAYYLSKGSAMSRILAALPARWTDRLINRSLLSDK